MFLFLFCAGLGTVLARPAQVILLRHGEKPTSEADVHLSDRGRARAVALAPFLTTNTMCTQHGLPTALFAPKLTRRGRGGRAYETLEPLAEKLKVPIETPHGADDYRALAERVLTDPAYDQKTVVICWTHEYLPELARKLGAKAAPEPWKSSVYDVLWVITYRKHRATLARLPQHLLPGDAAE